MERESFLKLTVLSEYSKDLSVKHHLWLSGNETIAEILGESGLGKQIHFKIMTCIIPTYPQEGSDKRDALNETLDLSTFTSPQRQNIGKYTYGSITCSHNANLSYDSLKTSFNNWVKRAISDS